ncbi:MAG: imidazoleglycerol-phosphate dehydratase HisB [Brevinematia bacterium]
MRIARYYRKTSETDIEIELNLDGSGVYTGSTGIGFFDHMINTFSKHSGIDIVVVKCLGDTHVDFHHLIEDFGIVLGNCFYKALGSKKGIKRFGFASVPLDESLTMVSIDVSGRSYIYFDPLLCQGSIKDFDMELLEVFFSAFVREAKITLHASLVRGFNKHHISESLFKSFAVAIKESINVVSTSIPSTKDVLE